MPVRGRIGLVKKLSVVQTARRVRELVMAYVDEITKEDIASGFFSGEFATLQQLPKDKRYRCYGFLKEVVQNLPGDRMNWRVLPIGGARARLLASGRPFITPIL